MSTPDRKPLTELQQLVGLREDPQAVDALYNAVEALILKSQAQQKALQQISNALALPPMGDNLDATLDAILVLLASKTRWVSDAALNEDQWMLKMQDIGSALGLTWGRYGREYEIKNQWQEKILREIARLQQKDRLGPSDRRA